MAMGKFATESELIFADAAISFLHDVAYGREVELAFNGVTYNIDSSWLADMYHYLLSSGNWRRTLDSIEPRISQYQILKHRLNEMQGVLQHYPHIDSMFVNDTECVYGGVRFLKKNNYWIVNND
jgi:hypothetical protein